MRIALDKQYIEPSKIPTVVDADLVSRLGWQAIVIDQTPIASGMVDSSKQPDATLRLSPPNVGNETLRVNPNRFFDSLIEQIQRPVTETREFRPRLPRLPINNDIALNIAQTALTYSSAINGVLSGFEPKERIQYYEKLATEKLQELSPSLDVISKAQELVKTTEHHLIKVEEPTELPYVRQRTFTEKPDPVTLLHETRVDHPLEVYVDYGRFAQTCLERIQQDGTVFLGIERRPTKPSPIISIQQLNETERLLRRDLLAQNIQTNSEVASSVRYLPKVVNEIEANTAQQMALYRHDPDFVGMAANVAKQSREQGAPFVIKEFKGKFWEWDPLGVSRLRSEEQQKLMPDLRYLIE